MEFWLIFIILSLTMYLLLQRSMANKTRLPVWTYWLAMMMPTFIWIAWAYFVGEERPLPVLVVIIPLVLGLFFYRQLVQIGKPTEEEKEKIETETPPKPEPTLKLSQVRPIDSQEEKALRNCFPWNVYYLQNIDYRPQAILCRGKLKAVPDEAYSKIKQNIDKVFGDRFFLIFQESFRGQPFFALVPNPQAQIAKDTEQTGREESSNRVSLALILLLITLVTTTTVGLNMSNVAWNEAIENPSLMFPAIGYSLALISILGIHELGHYFMASHYKISTSLPYFIPFPFFLGTIGAFVQRKSPIPHRRALFDVAISGPIAGLLITIPVLLWGFSLSEVVPLQDENVLHFDSLDLHFSFLVALLGKLALGNRLQPEMGLDLHPLAVAGYIGILFTTLNLMPIGSLDGGHIVHAMFGQRMAIAIGQITRIISILFAMVYNYFWIWAILLWLMPLIDRPALNDVTELDNWRDFSGLITLAILVIILLPLPAPIAQLLNI